MTNIIPPNSLKRDSLIMGLIGSAHFTSHFFQLSLPPLFPLLHDTFNVSYVTLGSLLTVFYLVSGSCQAFAGILVDRYGSRPVLMVGILTMAISIGLCSLVPVGQFWIFYPLMALAALGNGVFHPADLAALSHQVSPSRLGRAFSIHGAAGRAGFAAAPLVISTVAITGHWRIALVVAACLGLIVAFLFFRFTGQFLPEHHHEHHDQAKPGISYRQLITMPAILLGFGYFLFTTAAGSGFQAFSSVSFVNFFHVTLPVAATTLSIYLVSSAFGMITGGFIADHTSHHVRTAVTGLASSAILMVIIATGVLPFSIVIALILIVGFCEGMTAPSRDILIKGSAPSGSTGRVFGFVYSGVDAGAMLAPLLFGALVDMHAYQFLFLAVAAFYAAGIPFVMPMGQRQVAKIA